MKKFLINDIEKFLNKIKQEKAEFTYITYKNVLYEAVKYIKFEDNRIDITDYKSHISKLNVRTIAKKISILRKFFEFLGDKYKIIGDEHIHVSKTTLKPVNIEYIKKALKTATLEEYLAIMLIFSLGIRVSEAVNIKIEDIKDEYIIINSKLIIMHPKLKNLIDNYLNIKNNKIYLFEKNGKKISANKFRKIIKDAFKRHNIDITPTQLKHTFIFYMLEKGAQIDQISILLGYQFISNTNISNITNSKKLENYIKAHPLCS